MNYVAQETRTSCGVACVAMVAGVSFEEAGKAIGKIGITRSKDLARGLRALGVTSGDCCLRITTGSALPPLCIAKVTWFNGRRHWVVVRNARVFDPANPRQTALTFEHGKITSFLPVSG